MPNNPYLTLVDSGQQAASGNPYLDTLQGDADRSEAQLRASATQAITVDPDAAARARRVAAYLGTTPPAVAALPQDAERVAKVKQISDATAGTPTLRRMYTDADFAKLAHDDSTSLATVEHAISAAARYIFSANQTGNTLVGDIGAGVQRSAAGASGIMAAPFGMADEVIQKLDNAAAALTGTPQRQIVGTPGPEGFLLDLAGQSEAKAKQLSPASDSIIQRGVSSGVQSATQSLMMLLSGHPEAALLGMASVTGGQSYAQARGEGMSPAQAIPFASSQAVIEYATEKLPVHALLGDLKAGAGFLKTIGHQIMTEVPGEEIATALQDLNEWAALPENKAKTFRDYLSERPAAALETLLATVVGIGANTGISHAAVKVADAATGTQRAAQSGDVAGQLAEALHTMADTSKLRERAPDVYEAFVREVTQDGPLENFYIDAQALQQSGVAEQLAQVSPTVAEQMPAALATGGVVRIPVDEFAGRVAGTDLAQPLIDHLKADPNGMSRAESQAALAEQGDTLRQDAERVLQARQEDDAFKAGREEVQQAINAQLTAAGRFTQDVNNAYSTLLANFYAVQGARAGVSPQEMFQRYPVKVVAESPAGATLDQGARGTFNPDTLTIALLKAADLSTFLHESGHFSLEVLADMAVRADAPAGVRQDMQTLLDWFGVKDLDTWRRMSLDQQRGHHEKFARGFEAYLFEGKAPSTHMQGVFQRFRAWLLNVYRSLRSLNVELNPDIRGVFDRMLATADQIREMETLRGFTPAFTPEEAAKLGVDFQAYHEAGMRATQDAITHLESRSLRDMQWLENARGRELKRLQKMAATKRREVKAEVTAEVMATPIEQARQYIKDLRGQHPKPSMDMIGEMFGFTSGDHLQKALDATPPTKETIEGLTDQRMLERYGELSSQQDLERAADEAVHNQARARFISTELNALAKAADARQAAGTDKAGRPRTVALLPRIAKQFAESVVARTKVRNLKPGQFTAAEAKAGRLAEKALKSGDLEMAAAEKRNQLLNNQAARAALEAQGEVEQVLRYLRRDFSSIDADYRDQIDALLERFDLRAGQSLKAIDKRTALAAWVESQREQGMEPDIPPDLLNESVRKSYKDLTVEELRGLRDTVKQIEHLGRLKHKLLTAKDQREFEAVRDTIVASIHDNAGNRKADTRTPSTTLGKAWLAVRNFGAAHIKAATWARVFDGGKDGGPVWEYLIRTANDRADMETTRRAQATEALHAILQPLLAKGGLGGKGTFFPSIGRSMNREQVIAMALNTGNTGNLQRMLGGEGWTVQQIQPVLATLTEADWKAVQAIWDHFEGYRPEIGAKERRVYGKEPAWVEPGSPITDALNLRGGYYPIKYDPLASNRAEQHNDAESAKRQLQGAYTSATTRRGFTKARAEEVNGRPLLYSLAGVYSGVNDVIHDLSWHEWLIDANKILRSDKIDGAIRSHYGPEAVRQFKTWVRDIAAGEQGLQAELDSALGRIRHGVSVAGLGFNVMSALMQPLGFTQSMVRIGTKWAGKGLAQYLAAPVAATRKVNEKSEFMAGRARTRFRELNELRNQVEGESGVRRNVSRWAYFLMMRCQQMVDTPTWLGAYEKATAEGSSEERAIALADQAVKDAQGSGQVMDLAAIERGGPAQKLFTVFYSFMNTALNVGVAQTMTASTLAKKAKLAADYLMLYTVPAVLGALLKDALTPGDAGDDDKLLRKLLGEQLSYLMGLFVVAREFSEAGKTALGLTDHPRDYSGPAGVRVIADTATAAKQAQQGEFDDQFRKAAINLLGDLLALPSAQINRTVTGAKALQEGKTSNPAALVFGFQEPH